VKGYLTDFHQGNNVEYLLILHLIFKFQKEYPVIYQKRFPTTESEAALFGDKPTIKQPMLSLRKPKLRSLRY
jgi:hypothetical protein